MSVAYSVVSLGPAIASSNGSGADPTLWYITRAAGVSAYVLLFDPFITFSVVNLLLPIGEPYQSLGLGLGVLGLYALIVVLISSWLRRYISHRLWRALHYGSFGVFILVTLHGLLSGSDSGLGWLRSVYFAALASMFFLTVMRLAMPVGGVRANR